LSGTGLGSAPLDLVHLVETGSTNTDALALAVGGRPTPFWVMADRQTAGKGRAGRPWVSLPGNFHASCAVLTRCQLRHAGQIALVAGVALREAVCGLIANPGPCGDCDFRLKWPNDLLVGAAKCGGILIESTRDPTTGDLIVVIGFGVNLVAHTNDLGRIATNLGAHGLDFTSQGLLGALRLSLDAELARWHNGAGFDVTRARWLAAATPIGAAMSVHAGGVQTEGRFGGLDDEGALVLEMDGGASQTVSFGDVTLISAVAKKA
jgi:BirA family transcriptional regulator, biotin operon repressor / biotin---[acetyl-CoA-carboxylase] ligase